MTLSVDAHTAHHLFHECLKGELMKDRTVILVSHHVQLCAPGAAYIVALDNGRTIYDGNYSNFQNSKVLRSLVVSSVADEEEIDVKEEAAIEEIDALLDEPHSDEGSSTVAPSTAGATVVEKKTDRKPPRVLVDEEKRAVGRISREVWLTYIQACGNKFYWFIFALVFGLAAVSPVLENGWLKTWAAQAGEEVDTKHDARYYIGIYALVSSLFSLSL
jgi:hypothetical protein